MNPYLLLEQKVGLNDLGWTPIMKSVLFSKGVLKTSQGQRQFPEPAPPSGSGDEFC